jgi:hypothetical protein
MGQTENANTPDETTLTISPERVCSIIIKAKQIPTMKSEPGYLSEFISLIHSLPVEEQIDLVALAWLGRRACSARDWPKVLDEATRAHNRRTADCLIRMPLVGDALEKGLAALGYPCEEFAL